MRNISISLLFFSSLAMSQPIEQKSVMGEEAKTMAQALKMAGVIPKESSSDIDYSVQKVICHTANAYTDGLPVYDCKLNQKKIGGASAKVLYEALVQLKIPVDAAMSQTWVTANQLFCKIQFQDQDIPVQYHCQFS
jgi:hypothetical protein